MSRSSYLIGSILLGSLALTGCQQLSGMMPKKQEAVRSTIPPAAQALIRPASGSGVSGHVWFSQQGDGLGVHVKVAGLNPNQFQGIHIHEKGDCSAPDATSAGGHFNPDSRPHGAPSSPHSHAGDLPNLTVDAQGRAELHTVIRDLTPQQIMGRAVVIHAGRDDYTSQPAGNSGSRVGCGVISN